jgi:hypothetical protein
MSHGIIKCDTNVIQVFKLLNGPKIILIQFLEVLADVGYIDVMSRPNDRCLLSTRMSPGALRHPEGT